jgi:tetraacyldisaccharide-1-P 4'-kinase
VFFSFLKYGNPYLLFGGNSIFPVSEKLIALSGIADASLFIDSVSRSNEYIHFEFGDHHRYRQEELQNIVKNYGGQKYWITTEKDAVRLMPFKNWFLENGIVLWVQPVVVEFLKINDTDFAEMMLSYMKFYYPEPAPDSIVSNDAE